jgi:hypothetical protein
MLRLLLRALLPAALGLAGVAKFGDVTATQYVILGVCEARSGDVYILALHPYSVLKVSAKELAKD